MNVRKHFLLVFSHCQFLILVSALRNLSQTPLHPPRLGFSATTSCPEAGQRGECHNTKLSDFTLLMRSFSPRENAWKKVWRVGIFHRGFKGFRLGLVLEGRHTSSIHESSSRPAAWSLSTTGAKCRAHSAACWAVPITESVREFVSLN